MSYIGNYYYIFLCFKDKFVRYEHFVDRGEGTLERVINRAKEHAKKYGPDIKICITKEIRYDRRREYFIWHNGIDFADSLKLQKYLQQPQEWEIREELQRFTRFEIMDIEE